MPEVHVHDCPQCKKTMTVEAKDLHGWYWICPKCGLAVTMYPIRYCSTCKKRVIASTVPSFNLVDFRPWWDRGPWQCLECRNETNANRFYALVERVVTVLFAIAIALIILAVVGGGILSYFNVK